MSRRLCLALLAAAALAACFSASASGAARFYTPAYGGSEPELIGGFDLGSDGTLAPIAGSPFPASQLGFGGLVGLAFTPDGSRAASGYLFTGGVQGYSVPASGIFQRAAATPSASAISISISPDGRFAFAPTREFMGVPAEGVRCFAVNADGSLAPLPSGGSGEYTDVALTPDGRFLYAAASGQIERFAVGADGSLKSLGTTPAPSTFLLAAAPDGRFLFALVYGGSSSGFASYAVGGDGGLQQVGLPALVSDSSPKYYAMAPDGRHLYLADSNQDAIHTFAIGADGAPSVVGSMPIEDPESVGVSPDGRFLVYYRGGGSDNALGLAAIGADGVPASLGRETPWNTGEPEPIVFQPHPAPVASFAVKPGAPGRATRFDAGGSARAARFDWDFGDGAKLADGGPSPSHTYAKAGAYPVSLTVTDASGCSTGHVYDGHTTVCPGGASATASGSADTLPALSNLKAKPKQFKPKPKGRAKGKFGTTFRYRLTEAATVRFAIERKLKKKGRKVRFKRTMTLTQKGKAGANKLKWNGRRKGKPLPAGSYRATVVATDRAGGRSAAKKVGFRILPLP